MNQIASLTNVCLDLYGIIDMINIFSSLRAVLIENFEGTNLNQSVDIERNFNLNCHV